MCGIAGYLCASSSEEELRQTAVRMAERLMHRGPDDSGVWVDGEAGIALGFRRLAILDLSTEGHQPMLSEDGRYVIVFNGEVYNFQNLRRELEPKGHRFRGNSDTEVMLAAITEWGVEPSVKQFVGMFAFALWDRRERCLYLVRDRVGIKPLYYGSAGETFLFGSELKALAAHPDFQPEIDRNAIALQMQFAYIPAPYSIYRGIRKLPPGCILKIPSEHRTDPSAATPSPYWSARDVAEGGAAKPFQGTEQQAIDELDNLLREAVRLRMIADVPLGAFLSGGVDSSTIVALMQAQSARPAKTFTIGFHEDAYNEASHAKAIANHLGTEHTELYVTPEEAIAVIPRLPEIYDEPFSDSSQIPTYLVAALTRRHVTVSLSGDGGDELFGGYNRYFWGTSIWRKVGWMPSSIRRAIARGFRQVSPEAWNRMGKLLEPALPASWRVSLPGDKAHKFADILPSEQPEDLYKSLVSHWIAPARIVLGLNSPVALDTFSQRLNLPTFVQRMMLQDMVTYLPDDILAKVDRATMAASLEGRVPLLDHRVIEFAARIPLSMKIRNGSGKWLLRQVLHRYVPRQLMDHPKMGFGVPIDAWLRGPLRDWCESLLAEDRLHREGFFHPEPIRQIWQEHLVGSRNWQYYLWDVLMFQAWHEHWERAWKRR